jgi:hypothetical protein
MLGLYFGRGHDEGLRSRNGGASSIVAAAAGEDFSGPSARSDWRPPCCEQQCVSKTAAKQRWSIDTNTMRSGAAARAHLSRSSFFTSRRPFCRLELKVSIASMISFIFCFLARLRSCGRGGRGRGVNDVPRERRGQKL